MSDTNVKYKFEGDIGYGTLPNGVTFLFDAYKYSRIKDYKWYLCGKGRQKYLTDRYGILLHNRLFDVPKGMELDHISLDTFDNRSCNVRIATHQQNQMNQPLQSNNTSGYSGVRFNKNKQKFVARIKISQKEIHLGFYNNLKDAVFARDVGVKLMFGEYGRLALHEEAPLSITIDVVRRCLRFKELSVADNNTIKYYEKLAGFSFL